MSYQYRVLSRAEVNPKESVIAHLTGEVAEIILEVAPPDMAFMAEAPNGEKTFTERVLGSCARDGEKIYLLAGQPLPELIRTTAHEVKHSGQIKTGKFETYRTRAARERDCQIFEYEFCANTIRSVGSYAQLMDDLFLRGAEAALEKGNLDAAIYFINWIDDNATAVKLQCRARELQRRTGKTITVENIGEDRTMGFSIPEIRQIGDIAVDIFELEIQQRQLPPSERAAIQARIDSIKATRERVFGEEKHQPFISPGSNRTA